MNDPLKAQHEHIAQHTTHARPVIHLDESALMSVDKAVFEYAFLLSPSGPAESFFDLANTDDLAETLPPSPGAARMALVG